MLRWKLPSPRAIIALESVVRTGSVTAAAAELCVTQSAISKQIAHLEEWFGQSLFHENRRHMQPTQAAIHLADAAGVAWGLLATAVDEVVRQGSSSSLRVLAPASFAMRWLLPRLPQFQSANTDIKVSVRQTHSMEEWKELPFDVVIRRGEPPPTSLATEFFLSEQLLLVANPNSPWAHASALDELTFLEADSRPGELMRWIRAAGQSTDSRIALKASQAKRFGHFYIALETALAGQGALVAPDVVVADLIRDGSLATLFPEVNASGPSYWVGLRQAETRNAPLAFASWVTQVGQDWFGQNGVGTRRPLQVSERQIGKMAEAAANLLDVASP